MHTYILDKKKNLIAIVKIGDNRYDLLVRLARFKVLAHTLISIIIPVEKLEKCIENKLPFRLQDTPSYDPKKWKESDIFEKKTYKGKEYKLCNTGYDSQIIFLINLYNSFFACESGCGIYYLYFTNNHKEFEDWKINEKNKLE